MAQSALTTLMKRDLLDNNMIENIICPTIEKLSYMWQLGSHDMADEHTRNANISVSFSYFIRLPILSYSYLVFLSFRKVKIIEELT